MLTKEELISKIGEFERDVVYNESETIEYIKKFKEKFPKGDLQSFSVEKYTKGEDYFIYYLDQLAKKYDVALIGGRSALQFYLWYNKKEDKYYKRDGRTTEIISEQEAEKEFVNIKKDIIKIVESVHDRRYDEIDVIETLHQKVRMKIAWMYFPDKFTSLMTKSWINKVAKKLELEFDEDSPVETNHKIIEYIKSIDEFDNWHSHKIGKYLDYFFNLSGKYGKNKTKSEYGIAGPSDFTCDNVEKIIPLIKEKSQWYSDWNYRITEEKSKDIKKPFWLFFGSKGMLFAKAKVIDYFTDENKINEIITNQSENFLPNQSSMDSSKWDEDHKKKWVTRILFKIDDLKKLDNPINISSLKDIHGKKLEMHRKGFEVFDINQMEGESNDFLKSDKINYSKNTIFYGPPGTGKTFSTKREAVRRIEND